MNELCGQHPCRFRSFDPRFAGVVYPGEPIAASFWQEGSRVHVRATARQRGEPVLEQAVAEIRP